MPSIQLIQAVRAYAETNQLYSRGEMLNSEMNISPRGMISIESIMCVKFITARI